MLTKRYVKLEISELVIEYSLFFNDLQAVSPQSKGFFFLVIYNFDNLLR